MKKLLLASVLALGITGCSKDHLYNHNSYNVDEVIKGTTDHSKTWEGMGFTKNEFKIYSSADMTPEEAQLWKNAGIAPQTAARTYPEWKSIGVSNSYAIYFVKNANATPVDFKNASQAFDDYGVLSNQDSMTQVLRMMQKGQSADKSVSSLIATNNRKQAQAERDAIGSETIKLCGNKIPQSIYQYVVNNNTKNPYAFEGKCYLLNTQQDYVKWISDHQVLIVPMSQINASNVIYIYSDNLIKFDNIPIVIGTEPETFANSFGGNNVVPTFKVVGYYGN